MDLKIKLFGAALAASMAIGISGGASAATFTLESSIQCSLGNQENGIAIDDVTGNNGGATDCWGTYNGNDSNQADDGFVIDGVTYSFISKQDVNDDGSLTPTGADIGLTLGGSPDLPDNEGTWAFDFGALDGDFLIVLKAANSPGFAVWLFEGLPDSTSFMGDWRVAWGNDLSHLSVYGTECADKPCLPPVDFNVPVPAGLPLVLTGLGVMGVLRARKRKQA